MHCLKLVDSIEEICKMMFNSTILTIPGLTGSGPLHWQTLWEQEYNFKRIHQLNWDEPVCNEWISVIESYLKEVDLTKTIVVAHSLGCITIAAWAKKHNKKLKGALLVAPCDTERNDFPLNAVGFKPIPLSKFPFPTILVLSSNDNYISSERSNFLGNNWGSVMINIGNAGHINTASQLGLWKDGLEILKKLDS